MYESILLCSTLEEKEKEKRGRKKQTNKQDKTNVMTEQL